MACSQCIANFTSYFELSAAFSLGYASIKQLRDNLKDHISTSTDSLVKNAQEMRKILDRQTSVLKASTASQEIKDIVVREYEETANDLKKYDETLNKKIDEAHNDAFGSVRNFVSDR